MAKLRRNRRGLKVVFAGPTVYGLELDWGDIELRRPAQQGDVEQAVADGASVIGIVDGHYQQVGAVWHKEILFALKSGVAVYGSSSMGALRAAECEAFGMVPIGKIARAYCRGDLCDDADVALTNGPGELGFPPLTEPMVTVVATVGRLQVLGLVDAAQAQALVRAAHSLFFADRTIAAMFERADLGDCGPAIRGAYLANHVDPKADDARALVETIRRGEHAPQTPLGWDLVISPFWNSRTVRSEIVTRQ